MRYWCLRKSLQHIMNISESFCDFMTPQIVYAWLHNILKQYLKNSIANILEHKKTAINSKAISEGKKAPACANLFSSNEANITFRISLDFEQASAIFFEWGRSFIEKISQSLLHLVSPLQASHCTSNYSPQGLAGYWKWL